MTLDGFDRRLRLRRSPVGEIDAGGAAAARRLPGGARGRDRARRGSGNSDRRHLARRADGRRGRRLLGRPQPRRPRRRPLYHEDPQVPNFVSALPRAGARGGDDDRDRADDHGRRARTSTSTTTSGRSRPPTARWRPISSTPSRSRRRPRILSRVGPGTMTGRGAAVHSSADAREPAGARLDEGWQARKRRSRSKARSPRRSEHDVPVSSTRARRLARSPGRCASTTSASFRARSRSSSLVRPDRGRSPSPRTRIR